MSPVSRDPCLPQPVYDNMKVTAFHPASLNITADDIQATVTDKIRAPSLQPELSPTNAALRPLPYHVHRTASQGLPVYHLAKRGGNLHQTRVRKVDGDLEALKDDLQQALGLKKEDVVINRLSRQIIIKVLFSVGNHSRSRLIRWSTIRAGGGRMSCSFCSNYDSRHSV
jgi:hypothetical protein